MKVIFLDFDGVIVVPPHTRPDLPGRDLVARLNRIVDATGAKVVVSSDWRILNSREGLLLTLRDAGFTGEMVAAPHHETPHGAALQLTSGLSRADEIWQWLQHGGLGWERSRPQPVESYVVLEDGLPSRANVAHCWVATDFYQGLTDPHVEQAIEILNRRAF